MGSERKVIEEEIGRAFDTAIRLDVPRSEFMARVRQVLNQPQSSPLPDVEGLRKELHMLDAELVMIAELIVHPATDPLAWVASAQQRVQKLLSGVSAPAPQEQEPKP